MLKQDAPSQKGQSLSQGSTPCPTKTLEKKEDSLGQDWVDTATGFLSTKTKSSGVEVSIKSAIAKFERTLELLEHRVQEMEAYLLEEGEEEMGDSQEEIDIEQESNSLEDEVPIPPPPRPLQRQDAFTWRRNPWDKK